MSDREKRISDYMDALNQEKIDGWDVSHPIPREDEKPAEAAKLISGLYKPTPPASDFQKRLISNVSDELAKARPNKRKRLLSFGAVGVAAAALVVMAVFLFSMAGMNTVSAMEKAFEAIQAYHGVLEFEEVNALGEKTVQSKLEVWVDKSGRYYVRELEGPQEGLITVNNGLRKWQLQPELRQVRLFSAFPDPAPYSFEIGKEIETVKAAASVKIVGEVNVSGRLTEEMEVVPKGGQPYRIWVDKETRLPLKKESAFQNALQYRVTYTAIAFYDSLPAELMAYRLPEGYSEAETNPIQVFTGRSDLTAAAGFAPIIPETLPDGYGKDYLAVQTTDKVVQINCISQDKATKVVILQGVANSTFIPASRAVLGTVGQSMAEIQSPVGEDTGILKGSGPYAGMTGLSSIRWQDNGFEYAVTGNVPVEVLSSFVRSLTGEAVTIPQPDLVTDKPQVAVPVDVTVEENEQKSVDAGHSPWRLDPLFVTRVFVSLKISPEGITGDYPIHDEDMTLIKNDGVNAIVEVSGVVTPVSRVYLKRLIRQDSTGIWTVVGYDPVE